ncbi:MAG: nicotinate-nucleotide--dimethylbenzimidazole phosphoribosyltransferase [Alphaproteobacteria bacterium]|nr:nicotinate-nucleotide--dimethylbenzimidazole phosphoribosyltransferase [Alphaproteobacteria bacterium]MBL6936474.1 nicotinate-nucleotide--dimethylbenzimidazole phosphoribosyltransferase [Alphaproteobacteria bacterium]MBL7098475.1 nicotinate-nucleotide--dimethylbenzimidazole phosphoribosyltransferase [Alphaproteobacteria bacterium]
MKPFSQPAGLASFLGALPQPDPSAREAAALRQQQLTKPPGSLGMLEQIAIFLAGWQGPAIHADRIQVTLFAGNHGVTKQGVSPYPPEVTGQMVANFNAGGAAINALAGALGLNLSVHALDLDRPTGDISVTDAMTVEEALDALNAGIAAVDPASDVLVIGEMGIGNTTIAAALCAVSLGGAGADWAGAGTGLDTAGVVNKARVIDRALARSGSARDAFATLKSLGGRELAAMAGAVCAARHHRVPVLLDGFVACAALAPLVAESPGILDHCLAGHRSAERGHARLLEHFNLRPLLDLNMRLGEGSGAALATAVIRAAVATHTGMATFDSAGVSDRG